MDPRKTHGVGMPYDVNKGDGAGPTLSGVHKVSRPGIIAHIGFTAKPDIEPVKRVVQQRDVDSHDLKNWNKRQAGKKFYLRGVGMRAIRGKSIGDEMLKQERANWDDAAQRVQAAQQERMAFTGTNRRDSALDRRGNTSHVLLCSDQICEANLLL